MTRSRPVLSFMLITACLGCGDSKSREPAPTTLPVANTATIPVADTATIPVADTATIQSLEEQLRQAIVAGDTATMAHLWAPEYLSTSAVGHTSDRAQSLVAYGGGLVKVDTARVRDVQVRPYGTTAVSIGMMDWTGSAAGRPFGGTVRFQHVWVYSDGAWRLVASQLTNQP